MPLWVQDSKRWGCLDPSFAPPPVAPSSEPVVTLASVVLDYATQMPLQGLSVKFCTNMDPDCPGASQAIPVPGTMDLVTAVPIRTGSLGYLRQEAPGHVPQDYFLLAPMLVNDATYTGPANVFFLVSNTAISGFINDVGINVDPTLGIISVAIVDCNGARVEGAKVTLPELGSRPELRSATGYALNNRFPRPDAVTDSDGNAGVVNVPLGPVAIEATVNGQSFGSQLIRVLGNRITSATIRPLYQTGR